MARKVVPLTLDSFAELGAPCRTCLFWELDPVRRLGEPRPGEAKESWISEVLREWGSCGRVATVDGDPVGFVAYAPPAYVPGIAAFPTAPVSPDAVVLTTAWVHPRHAGGGLGRMLIQATARDLIQRGGIGAVEAFAVVGERRDTETSACTAPAEFLARVGFKTHRAHPTHPRMRMDLSETVSWREEVNEAWGRLIHVVRPRRRHAPAPMPRQR